MNSEQQFDKTEIYQIKIKGFLDDKWSDWFDGFTITGQNGETLLVGLVADQSALLGLLVKISQLNLLLLTLKRLESRDK